MSKLIEPGNSRERNKRIAQLGDFAEMPEFEIAFIWRWRATFVEWQMKHSKLVESARLADLQLNKEIGEAVRGAMLRGDWQFLDRLAKATEFVAENFKWKANSICEFGELLGFGQTRFLDPLRATIAQEYFDHSGFGVDEKKKSRKAFMPYIASKLNREVDATGTFAKSFDRACKALGIRWRK